MPTIKGPITFKRGSPVPVPDVLKDSMKDTWGLRKAEVSEAESKQKKEEKAVEQPEAEKVEKKGVSEPQEEHKELSKGEYYAKLVNIKGVGPKSAKDLLEKYPEEKDLKEAVKAGEELHNNDKIDRVVKEAYAEVQNGN